jgi:uncharacterized protein DUF3631/DnaA-like protein
MFNLLPGGAVMSRRSSDIWSRVLTRLQAKLNPDQYFSLLKPTSLVDDRGDVIVVRVTNDAAAEYIRDHYLDDINAALNACGRRGVRVEFVAGEVGKPGAGSPTQGERVDFEVLEPWRDPVEGAALLDELTATFERYLSLPDHAAPAIALWVLHTYTYDAAPATPTLALLSPTFECGKTTVVRLLTALVYRPMAVSNITGSVVFRAIECFQPTLLIDEADTYLRDDDRLRGILNSGHTRKTARVLRNVGDDFEPKYFSTWCPKVIAMNGRLPRSLESRSIQVRMCRQVPGSKPTLGRDDQLADALRPTRQRALRWADDHISRLSQNPSVPAMLGDRTADCWRPLLAIADRAGQAWRRRARVVAEALNQQAWRDEDGGGVELLRDLKALFGATGDEGLPELPIIEGLVSSWDMIQALSALPDRPWGTWRGGMSPISQKGLATLLDPFGIAPTGYRRVPNLPLARSYRREDFNDAFARYVHFSPRTCDQVINSKQTQELPNSVSDQQVIATDQNGESRSLVDHLRSHVDHPQLTDSIEFRSHDHMYRGKSDHVQSPSNVINLVEALQTEVLQDLSRNAKPTNGRLRLPAAAAAAVARIPAVAADQPRRRRTVGLPQKGR